MILSFQDFIIDRHLNFIEIFTRLFYRLIDFAKILWAILNVPIGGLFREFSFGFLQFEIFGFKVSIIQNIFEAIANSILPLTPLELIGSTFIIGLILWSMVKRVVFQ